MELRPRLRRPNMALCGQKVTDLLQFQEIKMLKAENPLALLRIHRRVQEAVSSYSHLEKKRISCHLTLHFEHLRTNAKPAGYLLLPLALSPEALLW